MQSNCLLKFTSFEVNNGRKIKFLKDSWLGNCPLATQFPELFSSFDHKDITVADCWSEEHADWNLVLKRGLRDHEMTSWIRMVELLASFWSGSGEDKIEWALEGGSGSPLVLLFTSLRRFPKLLSPLVKLIWKFSS